MDDYEVWKAAQLAIVEKVACPRCKAPAGTPCDWGVTTNPWASHKPRIRKGA